MWADLGAIDLLMSIPRGPDDEAWRLALSPLLKDHDSRSTFKFPAEYMYKDLPAERFSGGGASVVVREMDRFGVSRGMITTSFEDPFALDALAAFPDRFLGCFPVDPNQGTDGVRALRRAVDVLGVVAASAFPCGYTPQVPINDKRFFPIYAACVELDIPIFVCAGIPGPRVPFAAQHVELIEDVCCSFPELKFVTRHGCEPWTDLAVTLMRRFPNLHYSTSAFSPRHYPAAIIEFANDDGADRVLYAGYFPMGLSLERIFRELEAVPFADHVWPRFLRNNAIDLLKLKDPHR